MAGAVSLPELEKKNIDVVQGLDENEQKELARTEPVKFAKQQIKMQDIFALLATDHFDAEETYLELRKYIGEYKRILYSVVSNNVYNIEKDLEERGLSREKQTPFDTLLHNLETLLDYTSDAKNVNPSKGTKAEQGITTETKKAVWKLWDHVNLAHRQFQELRISEGDYKKRFEEQVNAVEARTIKESTSQMLTVVGIFTALAFVAVGGISSLGDILSGLQSGQIVKLLIVACVWGIGMLNVVFLFLFGIGRLTNKELKSNDSEKIWKRYPAYFWSNYILVSLIVLFGWLYYSHNRSSYSWIDRLIKLNPELIGLGVFVLILLGIGAVAWLFTKPERGDQQ